MVRERWRQDHYSSHTGLASFFLYPKGRHIIFQFCALSFNVNIMSRVALQPQETVNIKGGALWNISVLN